MKQTMKNSKIIIKKIPNKPEINLQIILKLIDKEKTWLSYTYNTSFI